MKPFRMYVAKLDFMVSLDLLFPVTMGQALVFSVDELLQGISNQESVPYCIVLHKVLQLCRLVSM